MLHTKMGAAQEPATAKSSKSPSINDHSLLSLGNRAVQHIILTFRAALTAFRSSSDQLLIPRNHFHLTRLSKWLNEGPN